MVDFLQLQAARRELELLKVQEKLVRENGLAFYRPHEKQEKFHAHGECRYRYARTGNRFGKSDMGAAEDVSWAVGERLWYPKDDQRRKLGLRSGPTKGLIICTDWDKSTEIFTQQNEVAGAGLGKLWKFIPKGMGAKPHRNHSGAIDIITLDNGSTIHIDTVQSFKQNKMSQESSSWDYIHVDEPCPEAMYNSAARGLMDRNGSTWILCTPLDEMWINDWFIPSRKTSARGDLADIATEDKFILFGSSTDNPYISREGQAAFESRLNEDEKACRIHGIPLAMAGVIYKEFNEDRHVYRTTPYGWAAMDLPPKDYTIRFAIDPHPRKPIAVLFAATAPTGETFFFRELYDPSALIPEVCSDIKAVTRTRFVYDALIDPIANTRNPIDDTTQKDTFLANGVFVVEAVKDPSAGILCVRQLLRDKLSSGKENLYFSAELTRTRYEFDHFVWDKDTGKPKKVHDDMMENLYRLCLGGLEYVSPPSEDDYKIIPQVEIRSVTLDLDFHGLDSKELSHRSRAREQFADAF